MKLRVAVVGSMALALPFGASAACLTDAEIEAALGEQVRARAFLIDTRALPERPLCSGLTLAQHIQRMRAQAFPEEAAREAAQRAELEAREAQAAARSAQEALAAGALMTRRSSRSTEGATARSKTKKRRLLADDAEPRSARRRNGAASYPNCSAARAAGAAPIRRGEAGYSRRLDRDGDGVACE